MTTKKRREAKTRDYKEILYQELEDPKLAAAYLTDAFDEGGEVFLLALKDVVEARGGIGSLAKSTELNREGLYAMLSKKGNPRLTSLSSILDTLGFSVTFKSKSESSKAA